MMTGLYCHHLMVVTQICNYAFTILMYGNTYIFLQFNCLCCCTQHSLIATEQSSNGGTRIIISLAITRSTVINI